MLTRRYHSPQPTNHELLSRVTGLLAGLTFLLLSACETIGTQDEMATAERPVNRLAEIQTQLGMAYLQEGKKDLAWKRLQRALLADPNYSPAHNALALLSEHMNRPAQAEQYYRRAIESDPRNSAAMNNYGSFLCRQKKWPEAESYFQRAAANPLYENPEFAQTNAGLCLLRAGQIEQAESYLRTALNTNPRLPAALIAMAGLSLKKGRHLSARAYLQRYLENAKHTPRSLWIGIQTERKLGDKNALASYRMLLKGNFSDSRETRLLLDSESK